MYAKPTDTTWFLNHMHEVASEPNLGGYRKLTWGVCTTSASALPLLLGWGKGAPAP